VGPKAGRNVTPGSSGFVYVATGAGYVQEALRSANSVRALHPSTPICLVTDVPPPGPHPFTDVLAPEGRVEHGPIDKILAFQAPYERVVFLDTDTLAVGDVAPLFDLLDRFDLAALQDVNRGWHYSLDDVPLPFTEFNTGVLVFRRTPDVARFFAEWRANHEQLKAAGFVNDQPAFRRTAYRSSLRIAPLPSEFHFLGNFPNAALWSVRLVHARGDVDRIARLANESLGPRAYVPDVGVIGGFVGRRPWLRTTLRVVRRMVRLLIRTPADSTATNPGRWWLQERPDRPRGS
jgi:hypothetical protein